MKKNSKFSMITQKIIYLGSTNKIKLDAVKEVAKEYIFLHNSSIFSVKSNSEVSEQPLSLDETISGARNRAKNAFKKTD